MNVVAWFSVRDFEGMDELAVTGVLTVRLKLAVAVAPFVSVTVTVYVVAALVAVGVPEIAPLLVEKLSPAGSAGETL
jgi:uncharacterized membrane protein HdeD (DUF308 family)